MNHRPSSLMQVIRDLEANRQLIRVRESVDPNLEMAEIQRRAYQAKAPAIYFERVQGSPFPAVANLFGTMERTRFIFRHTLRQVELAVKMRANPPEFLRFALREGWREPKTWLKFPVTGWRSLPKRVSLRRAPCGQHQTTIGMLPQIKSWPRDGGPFITLPQVFSEDPSAPGIMKSNLGMYRVQLGGNEYQQDQEVGVHYQIHRGLGIHHSKALANNKRLPVSIFVGGHPAQTFAAVMPLPEGLSELMFAGMLQGHRWRYSRVGEHVLSADADFCITGYIEGNHTKPEGPFGDHLGYYSLTHDFPVLRVTSVYHRPDAVWPFTVVGRPPQEDTSFGQLIHEITSAMVPASLPGVKALHAVDAAGVHPLLLAIGSERYVPYAARRPQEILTQANAILGFNQCSLAKYLLIVAADDDPQLEVSDEQAFFSHLLTRVDWRRDLHFQTNTTMDTLDYSAEGLNQGSKVVIAAAGEPHRELCTTTPHCALPSGYGHLSLVSPGVAAVTGPAFTSYAQAEDELRVLCDALQQVPGHQLPLVVLVDDAAFVAASFANFLWVCFTRSNPSHDLYGTESSYHFKHWGCGKTLVIDARIKPHHAPPLEADPEVGSRVDRLCQRGKSLYRIL